MDVAPQWYADWSRPTCSGEVRRCGGGDVPCRDAAIADGFRFYGTYTACRPQDLHTLPSTTTYVAAVALVLAGIGFYLLRKRARKRA